MHVYFPAISQLTKLPNFTQKKSSGHIGYTFCFYFVETFLFKHINIPEHSNAQEFHVQHFFV